MTKYYAWDGGQIIAEYEAWGTNGLIWKTSYVYLGGRLLATTSGADGSETRFHHPDRLGTRLVTNASDGAAVSEQWTLPFGNMQPFTSAPGGENPYQHPTLSNPSKKRFTTYDRSDATGLDYAVNRHYSPQQGRFTQGDPIGMSAASLTNPQTMNLYAYCGNDPINHVDPDGLFFGKLFGWIGKIFKWVARVVAVVMAVAAVLAVAWGFGVAAIKLGLAAFKFALDGWGNSKWTRILSAGIGAYFGFNAGKYARTPGTFPSGTGVGGVCYFNDPPVIRDSVNIVAKSSWLTRIGRGIGKAARFIGRRLLGAIGLLGDMEDVSEVMNPPGNGDQYIIEAGKFDYLFGRVAPDAHNTPRANENALQMKRLGVPDTLEGHQMLRRHLEDAASRTDNITRTFTNQYGTYEVHESLFAGPSGQFAKFESTWQVLATKQRRLTTVIPYGGPDFRPKR